MSCEFSSSVSPKKDLLRSVSKWRWMLAAGAWCLGASCVWAQAGAACDPQSHEVASTNACAVQHFQQVDTANNILYSDVMRALSAHERPALRQDQTAWSRNRTRECKMRHAADEGRADWPARYHDCLSAATRARRADLMHWLHHGQGPTQ